MPARQAAAAQAAVTVYRRYYNSTSLADHAFGPAGAGPWDFGRRPWKAGWLAMVVFSTAFKLYWDLK